MDNALTIKKEHYDKKLLSILEIVGACIINLYYNDLYSISIQTQTKSITDEYITKVTIFTDAVKKDRTSYKKTILRLHDYFISKTRFGAMTLQQFEDKYVSSFVPPEYFTALTKKQKDKLLYKIICSIITQFSAFCIRKIRIIVDNRGKQEHIDSLQDNILELQLRERENMLAEFINVNTKERETGIPVEMYEKLKGQIKMLIKENCTFKNNVSELEQKYNVALEQYAVYKQIASVLENPKIKVIFDIISKFDDFKLNEMVKYGYSIDENIYKKKLYYPLPPKQQQEHTAKFQPQEPVQHTTKFQPPEQIEQAEYIQQIKPASPLHEQEVLDTSDTQDELDKTSPPTIFNSSESTSDEKLNLSE